MQKERKVAGGRKVEERGCRAGPCPQSPRYTASPSGATRACSELLVLVSGKGMGGMIFAVPSIFPITGSWWLLRGTSQ